MRSNIDGKIGSHHLKRGAIVYVRQSSMKQVMENTESTARQYGLVEKAVELGWDKNLVTVIDDDLGKSASSAASRSGFQKLVADVAMGQVGIVMGLEMSRLARNNADFQQLLQICGTNNTLIYDADAVYDLMRLNDRLVLGFKGTMSEAELFTIRARLQGGALSKASRAELKIKLPVGFVYSQSGEVALDPDRQVQETLKLFFASFRKIGSSKGVVNYFNREGIKFPIRPVRAPHKGELVWGALSSSLSLRILHNPRYAGAYCYGRTKICKSQSGGTSYSKRERDQWHALVKDVHPGYLGWDEFEENEQKLSENVACDLGGVAREGNALLQSMAICGRCGRNYSTSYKRRKDGSLTPIYICNREQADYGKSICTYVPGSGIDDMVAKALLERMTPMAVDAAISVQKEIVKRSDEADKLLSRHVQRAQYEADLAKRRVMAVDPDNRLVAQSFEEDWNKKLVLLEQAKLEFEKKRKCSKHILSADKQLEIKNVAADFTKLWSHSATTHQDRKRITRLLIEDVTLKRETHEVIVYIRFKTGLVVEEMLRIPRSGNKATEFDPSIIQKIESMAHLYTTGQISKKLNEDGIIHPTLGVFNTNAVTYIFERFKIKTLFEKLSAKGYLTQEDIAEKWSIKPQTLRRWKKNGWVDATRYNDLPEYLYMPRFERVPTHIAERYESIISFN